jgi:chaperonin GroES
MKEQLPFRPLANQLLLKEIETSETSKGGIYLPETLRKPINQGEIVDMGEDVPYGGELKDCQFAIGNHVVFPLHAETRFQMDRKTYMIVPYDAVILSDYGYFKAQK